VAVLNERLLAATFRPPVRRICSGSGFVLTEELLEAEGRGRGVRGAAAFRGELDPTAEVIELEGRLAARAGRELQPNQRLREVE
jgi:hypothetical protein